MEVDLGDYERGSTQATSNPQVSPLRDGRRTRARRFQRQDSVTKAKQNFTRCQPVQSDQAIGTNT